MLYPLRRPTSVACPTRGFHSLAALLLALLLSGSEIARAQNSSESPAGGQTASGVPAEDGAEESARQRIAVLPIVVHSGEDPEYIREGLADMIAARMEREGVLEVVRVDDPAFSTIRLDRAIQHGRDLGVDYVLFGSFTRFGDGASLDMQCVATEQSPDQPPMREIFVHSGSIGEVIPDLHNLVGKVSRFAVTDYEESPAVASDPESAAEEAGDDVPGGGEQDIGNALLEARIRALEDQVRGIQEALEAKPTP